MNVLVVFDHPRRQSFCGAMLDNLVEGLESAGHKAEIADLRAEAFDPRLPEADEPDWADDRKIYSPEVLKEQARIARNDALAFVFPVWWWSFPATTKGWIDRVWNNGWAYGSARLPQSRALLIGAASASAEAYRKRGYDDAMRVQLVTGIMDYCGIAKAGLELFHDVTDNAEAGHQALKRARQLGLTYFS
ncbi:NAD(P)H oxidoreductase [Aestuariivirga sp.]|uniref:NAD(P)H oxidoreductase n=1 Tax=Aestuariivirga sp. TaxID=2650926 RepID=UPI0039E6FD35